MRPSSLLRASFLAAAFGAALSAQAVSIGLSSFGKLDLTNDPTGTIDESVVVQQGGFGTLTDLHIDFQNSGFPVSGTGTYSGPGGALNFSFAWSTNVINSSTQFISGTWTATGGTGTYLNATGSGTLGTVLGFAGLPVYDSFTTLRGNVEAVPEPASMAALAVGGLGLLRRRKKA